MYHALVSSRNAATAEQSICHYPKGSLVFKTWNYTNMDCANRRLECIFLEPSSIELLDLHNNFLFEVPLNAFSKVLNLLALDLSYDISPGGGVLTYLAERGCAALMGRFLSCFLPKKSLNMGQLF